ncbi:DUF262 domain-containing protein [Mycena indigotica]|uniref:DUF262 domain-containing protein n=1 Tax=Mycena indigotica TaxID=2126181 RepID=A0A8H6SW62_9AGAR|nr:DUF262 domain-containing protein [Mycena indigotica]KAF7306398.1 DUF262 domain-containing protein [Mycena indigotica]
MDREAGYNSDSDSESGNVDNIIGHKFSQARLESWTTKKLFDNLVAGRIYLDAKYQRSKDGHRPLFSMHETHDTLDVVWNIKNQKGLVDSLFRNAPVSQIVFGESTMFDDWLRPLIDGKQRLTTIRKFLSGEIPFENAHTGKKYWYIVDKSKRTLGSKEELPQHIRDEFISKTISCVIYDQLLPTEENDIFARLQNGVPLTVAEKLRVHETDRANTALKCLEDHLDRPDSWLHKDKKRFTLRRGKDRSTAFRYLSTILYTLSTPSKTLAPMAGAKSDIWLSEEVAVDPKVKAAMTAALTIYEEIAGTSRALMNRVAPVEFHATVVFVEKYRHSATLASLAEGIQGLKDDVRAKHPKEVKATQKVYTDMEAYIKKWAKGPNNKLRPGEISAMEQVMKGAVAGDKSTAVSVGKKRKRPSEEAEGSTRKRTAVEKRPNADASSSSVRVARTETKVGPPKRKTAAKEAAPVGQRFFNFQPEDLAEKQAGDANQAEPVSASPAAVVTEISPWPIFPPPNRKALSPSTDSELVIAPSASPQRKNVARRGKIRVVGGTSRSPAQASVVKPEESAEKFSATF